MEKTGRFADWYIFIPTIIGTAAAYYILFGGKNMDLGGWIAVVVALIGVIGTLIVEFLQLKRDGKTIDGINATANNTDKTTSMMQQAIQGIENTTSKTHEKIISSVSENIDSIRARNDKIDFIVKEFEYHKRIKNEFSEGASGRDIILAGITAVYEENARLNNQHRDDREALMDLLRKNAELQVTIGKLSQQVEDLKKAQTKSSEVEHPQPNMQDNSSGRKSLDEERDEPDFN